MLTHDLQRRVGSNKGTRVTHDCRLTGRDKSRYYYTYGGAGDVNEYEHESPKSYLIYGP